MKKFLLIILCLPLLGLANAPVSKPKRLVSKSISFLELPSGKRYQERRIEYRWDEMGTLHIKHINAYLNCCAKGIAVSANLQNQKISISEDEIIPGGICGCDGYYTIEYTIENLKPGIYHLEFLEPTFHTQHKDFPRLVASIDLRTNTRGAFSIEEP